MLKATPSNSSIAPGAHPGANVDWTLHDRYKAAVERLEALAEEINRQLDALTADPDLEDGGDLEEVCEDEGADTGDDEHILGRSEAIDQTKPNFGADDLEWSLGAANPKPWLSQADWGAVQAGIVGGDAEEQCEDEGAKFDEEPNCGWATVGNQGPRIGSVYDPDALDIVLGYASVGDEHL